MEIALGLVRRTLKYEHVQLIRTIGTTSESKPPIKPQAECDYSAAEPPWEKAKDYSELPGPKPLPVVGNMWRFIPLIGEYTFADLEKTFRRLHENHGDYVKLTGLLSMPDIVVTYDPRLIEKVYRYENMRPVRNTFPTANYYRQHFRQEVFATAKGVALTQGEAWYQERNKINPIMMQHRVMRQYIPCVEEATVEFVDRLRKIRKPNNKLSSDFVYETKKWALENIGRATLDTKLGCFTDHPREGAFDLFDTTDTIFKLIFELDFAPNMSKFFKTPKFYRMMRALDKQFVVSSKFVEEAVERIEENKRKGVHGTGEKSILEKLSEIDKNVAIVMALDMILAGVDTTATSLINTLYHLALNKPKQEKLREEINSLVPDDKTKLTIPMLEAMPYTKAVIKEASRMYPISPVAVRILTKDVVLGGHRLKEGTMVLLPMVAISRLEKNFKRPNEFIPERWLRETEDPELSYKNCHPFCVLPFGFGVRACVGQRFAELELKCGIVHFMKNFDVSYDGPPPKHVQRAFNALEDVHFILTDLPRKP